MIFWYLIIAFAKKTPFNALAGLSSETSGRKFGFSVHIHVSFVSVSRKCSGEYAQSYWLA